MARPARHGMTVMFAIVAVVFVVLVASGRAPAAAPGVGGEESLPACPAVMAGSQAYAFDGDPRGPFECFGACGPSCEHRGCSEVVTHVVRRTITGGDGVYRCRSCSYRARQCGTHEACRWHDAAIAGCGSEHPPGSRWQELKYRLCKRTADGMMAEYSPDKLVSWASGGGPYDGYLTFSELSHVAWTEGRCEP